MTLPANANEMKIATTALVAVGVVIAMLASWVWHVLFS
jgi:hypothetical protein